jgi:membrane protein DedA with SNARE-associated domain
VDEDIEEEADEEAEGGKAEAEAERPKPSRRTLILLVTPIIVITSMGVIATAFTPALAARHPLLLIALDSRNRFLVLAREVDLAPFIVVALLRRTFSDPLFYLLGRFYGQGALHWLEKKAGFGPLVTVAEKFFKKAGYPMVFAFPGAIVCALAGQTGMPPAGFMAANIAGTLTAILAVRRFSDAVSSPVEGLLGFFDRNIVVTTTVTVLLVILSLVLNWAQGKLDPDLEELEGGRDAPSDVEQGVQSDGDPGVGGDRLHRENDTRHE